MRVLLVHNHYQQPGGEDAVFNEEGTLLEARGHELVRYTLSNDQVRQMGPISLAKATLWNGSSYWELRRIIQKHRPDIVHFHNTFPLISPAAYYAAKSEKAPVVQTIHNYRPFCLNGVCFRQGKVCELCIGRFPVPGVVHKCYRGSSLQSAAVASVRLLHHDFLRTYHRLVDTFIISSEFAKNLMVRAGIPSEKLVVKPNLVISKEQDYISSDPGGYAIFVGRLDERKGIYTLLKAVENTGIPLKLVGEGDLGGYVKDWLKERPGLSIQMLGWLNKESVLEHIRNSNFLILPSEFYESFGNVIVEAFACGVPVLTSRMGAQADLVEDYHTGLLFQPGNADDLASKIRWFQDHPQELMQMRKAARGAYNAKYTTEHIYQQLLNIYQNTLIACCKRAQS